MVYFGGMIEIYRKKKKTVVSDKRKNYFYKIHFSKKRVFKTDQNI